jgi:hypothetical protein
VSKPTTVYFEPFVTFSWHASLILRYTKTVFKYLSPLLCITQSLIEQNYNFSKPTGLQNTKKTITFYFMLATTKCIQNLLNKSLILHKHETVYEDLKMRSFQVLSSLPRRRYVEVWEKQHAFLIPDLDRS